jgi:hypothetical protein
MGWVKMPDGALDASNGGGKVGFVMLRQRSRLEDELRELKRARQESSLQPWRDGRAEGFIPVAALSF